MSGALFGKNEADQTSGGGKRAFIGRMAKAAASGLYRNTIGYLFGGGSGEQDQDNSEEDMDKEYICVDYLERQSDIFVRWALKNEKTLMTLAKVKQSLHNT